MEMLPHPFATTQLTLLDAELEAEVAETAALIASRPPAALQRAGLAITNLTVGARRTGPAGKTVVELSRDTDLPEHGIRAGDIVLVADQPAGSAKKREIRELEKRGRRGVVAKTTKAVVAVVLEDHGDEESALDGRVWVVKVADDVTYRRMKRQMERLRDMSEGQYSTLVRVLFGLAAPAPVEEVNVDWFDSSLDESQREAVGFALGAREVAIIHGPPGTGKTHTLVELILQMVQRGLRVLVCGPSNVSVDNIVERLAPRGVSMVRLGHPARLLPSVVAHSLDVLTQTSDAAEIVRDVRADMDARLSQVKKARGGRERKQIWTDLKELRSEFRQREKKCVGDILRGARVVLATLHGAGGGVLFNEVFDVVVIDEASQALEAACWVPLLTANKVVCAGDHLQLPPTIKSKDKKGSKKKEPIENGVEISLETTLLDRLLSLYGDSVKRMLTTQYRMHESIMRFASDELYDGRLQAAAHVKARLLRDLPDVSDTPDTAEPLVFIDTQGGDFPEQEDTPDDDGERSAKSLLRADSKSNQMEAALVRRHVASLVEAGVAATDIAVITPYNAQLSLLAPLKDTFPGIELGSVDGFQGREKEAVVVSLVRSNDRREVGFLGERRRLNVAMTRPKRALTVIGDSDTLRGGGPFLVRWMDYLEANADLRYPDPADGV